MDDPIRSLALSLAEDWAARTSGDERADVARAAEHMETAIRGVVEHRARLAVRPAAEGLAHALSQDDDPGAWAAAIESYGLAQQAQALEDLADVVTYLIGAEELRNRARWLRGARADEEGETNEASSAPGS